MSSSQSDFHIFQRVGQPPTSSPAMPCWTLVDVWKNRSPTCCNNFDDDSGNGKHKKEPIVNPRNRIVESWNCISSSNSLFGAHICYLFTFVAAFMLRNQQLDDEAQPTNQPERGTTVIQIPSAEGSRGNKRCDFSNFSDQSIKDQNM